MNMVSPIAELSLRRKIASKLKVDVANVCIVGSTFILGQEGNDVDVLVYDVADQILEDKGFELDIEESYGVTNFTSWRKGNYNILQTLDRAYYMSEVTIAHAARYLANCLAIPDMTVRKERIDFHGEIRDEVADYLNESPF